MKKLALCLSLSALALVAGAQPKDLKVAIDATYEPFTFKTADGKPTGFDVDIALAKPNCARPARSAPAKKSNSTIA